ncbi:MAG: TorD/DmsD family molecular chaperone [Sulfuricella sp.]
MINPKQMQTVAAGRARTYAVLSALYAAPPSADLTEMIREGGLVQDERGPFGTAANDLTFFFREAASGTQLENELAAEHTRLFVLPTGVVPHEAFYADENQRLGGRVTVAVQQYYEEAAARLTGACLELPDHMGVELEFMKFLCDIEEQFWKEPNWAGLQKCLSFQNGFLTEHLLRWYRPLCERIIDETDLDMYRALARLTIAFLEDEQKDVPELTHEIHSEGRTPCVTES